MLLRALLVLVLTAPAASAQQHLPGPPPPHRRSAIRIAAARTTDRMAYIAGVASLEPDQLPLQAHSQSSLVWTSERPPVAEIARIRADLTRRYAALLQLLAARKLLDVEAARTMTPVIEIEIEDRRAR